MIIDFDWKNDTVFYLLKKFNMFAVTLKNVKTQKEFEMIIPLMPTLHHTFRNDKWEHFIVQWWHTIKEIAIDEKVIQDLFKKTFWLQEIKEDI